MTTPEPFNTAHIIQLRRRAAWVLWAEFWLRAVLPACALILAYVTVALFGFGSAVLLGLVAVAAVLSFGVALWRLTPPTASAIDRRIETVSGLAHRPFSMLDDTPETEGALTAALWAAHQRRLADTLRQAKTGHVSFQLARHDPLSLRLLLLLLLLVGLVMAGPSASTRLAAAFELPAWPFAVPVINAWITPPDYTNISPEPLAPDKTANALRGSKLTLIINHADTAPPVWLDGHRLKFTRLTDNSYRTDAILAASGRLVLGPWWDRLAVWNLTVLEPAAPELRFTKPPIIASGRLVLAWQVTDKYGLISLDARFAPAGKAQIPPQVLKLPTTLGTGLMQTEIGSSPFAGQAVSLWLTARNRAGVSAHTEPVTVILPPPDLANQAELMAATKALEQALAKGLQGPKLGAEQLQSLLKALQKARAQHAGSSSSGTAPAGGTNIVMSDVGQMAAQISADEAAGQTTQAQAELRQLENMLAQPLSTRPVNSAEAAKAQAAQELDKITQGQAIILDETNKGHATAQEQGDLQQSLLAMQQSPQVSGLDLPGLIEAAGAMSAAKSALQAKFNNGAAGAEMIAIQDLQKATAALAAKRKDHVTIGQGSSPIAGLGQTYIGINGMPPEQNSSSTAMTAENPAAIIQDQIIKQDSNPAEPAEAHRYFNLLLEDH